MYSNIYAECVGYAFWQCYDSQIGVTQTINSDADLLQELKVIVKEYSIACEIVEDESVLRNEIPKEMVIKVNQANCLSDIYP